VSGCCYLDTSALAKWYVEEPGSEAFEAFVNATLERRISRLLTVELRCLLARRRRAGEIDVDYETDAWATFTTHVAAGVFTVEPMTDARFNEARELIDALAGIPLRTLDALHLAAARAMETATVATADVVMRDAAEALGLTVEFFGKESQNTGRP
jgi:predicted nucleic acid-binding protein